MMNKFFAFSLFCCVYFSAFSQAFVTNNGAGIYMTTGSSMIIQSDNPGFTNGLANNSGTFNMSNGATMVVQVSPSYVNGVENNQGNMNVGDGSSVTVLTNNLYNNGLLNTQGFIEVQGNVKNDDSIVGNGDTIKLFRNWINNNLYSGTNSWVNMYGFPNPLITGSAVTTFNNLTLTGGPVVGQTINAVTTGLLVLNNAELATDVYEMYVSNPSTTAISRTTGFVSSVSSNGATGRLSRATNMASTYDFPIGSPSPNFIFRPVQITPAGANADEYGAMVVKGDATASGYDTQSFDDSLCAVNPNFFHQLFRVAGTDPIALTMTFDPTTDGTWTDQAEWGAPINNLWNYLGPSTAGNADNLSAVTVSAINNFTPQPFALAKKKFTINPGGPYSITQGQSAGINATVNTTSPIDSIAWTPASGLSCLACLTPTASPEITTTYSLLVKDATGCLASDSILVTVSPDMLLLPTAFSPNGDGENDYFHVLNKNIAKVDLQVFNRWGEKVYETEDVNDRGWDGTYKGIKQDMGVFVWQCQYQFLNSAKSLTASGNVTLVR